MKILPIGLTLSLLLTPLAGCQTTQSLYNTGHLNFRFQVTQANSQFNIKSIPSQTTHFEIEITQATGLKQSQKLVVTGQKQTQETQINGLPPGPTEIAITAFESTKPLASAKATVNIKANETTQATLELKELASKLLFNLAQALPLNMSFGVKMTGEGLEQPIEEVFNFKKGAKVLDFGILPPGKKTLEIRPGLKATSLSEQSFKQTVTIKADQATEVTLDFEQLFKTLGPKLSELTQSLSPAELLAFFAQLSPETLKDLKSILPPEILALLRQNPILAGLLGLDLALPTALPTTLPSTAPTTAPTPTPEATPAVSPDPTPEKRLEVLGLYLATRGLKIFGETAEDILNANDSKVLQFLPSKTTHNLALNQQVGFAVIRVAYNGTIKPRASFRITNLDNPEASVNNRTFPGVFLTPLKKKNTFGALVLLNKEDGSVQRLETAGRYQITIDINIPGKDLSASTEYLVTVN